MSFSIRRRIRALVAPSHHISCSRRLWRSGLRELKARGRGITESGAFLLGTLHGRRRVIHRFAYYDDLEPGCLDSGIVRLTASAFGSLWDCCDEHGLNVVADVHTHPGAPLQSRLDARHPMIAKVGHVAIIVPNFAREYVGPGQLGIYEYRTEGEWVDWSGANASRFFYMGFWS